MPPMNEIVKRDEIQMNLFNESSFSMSIFVFHLHFFFDRLVVLVDCCV